METDILLLRKALPESVRGTSDGIACSALIDLVQSGEFLSVLQSEWLQSLVVCLKKGECFPYRNVDEIPQRLGPAVSAFVQSGGDGDSSAAVLRVGALVLAVVCLKIHLQAAVTGPPFRPSKLSAQHLEGKELVTGGEALGREADNRGLSDFCVLGDPDATADAEGEILAKSALVALSIDGEQAYERTNAAAYLWTALELLRHPALKGTPFLAVWQGRAAFLHQRALTGGHLAPAPSLIRDSVSRVVAWMKERGALDRSFKLSSGAQSAQTLRALSGGVLKDPWRLDLEHEREREEENEETEEIEEETVRRERGLCSLLLLELALRVSYFGRLPLFDDLSRRACELVDFSYEITGARGRRREYQRDATAQLVVKTKSGPPKASGEKGGKGKGLEPVEEGEGEQEGAERESEEVCGKTEEVEGTGGNVAVGGEGGERENETGGDAQVKRDRVVTLRDLDPDTDILENVKLAEEDEDTKASVETALSALQQCLLLARCSYIMEAMPAKDELSMEELGAVVARSLVLPKNLEERKQVEGEEGQGQKDEGILSANWLVFSAGLWFRCKTEHHRSKTMERACLQLQALVDQFDDERPEGPHRLKFAHSVDFPNKWEAKRELGKRMLRIGSVMSAFGVFEEMKMWEEAVECLAVAGRKEAALEILRKRLEESPTPALWCSLGDLQQDPGCYRKAWDLSKQRLARAQRSLGVFHFRRGQLEEAAAAFLLALEINPLHANSWFTCGCAQMKLGKWKEALRSFGQVVALEEDQAEAWANLAAVHVQLENWKAARIVIGEAMKRARESWKIAESFCNITLRIRDLPGVFEGLRVLLNAGRGRELPPHVVRGAAELVLQDAPTLQEGKTGRFYLPAAVRVFEDITKHVSSSPPVFALFSRLLEADGQYKRAFEVRQKEVRALQQLLWEPQRIAPGEAKQAEKGAEGLAALVGALEGAAASMVACLRRLKEGEGKGGEGDILAFSGSLKMTLSQVSKKLRIKFEEKFASEAARFLELLKETETLDPTPAEEEEEEEGK
uniref:Uncharacterized protein n=1 Tax=Chromera velia CCMP2878 TaxID=1169474 RepID=A0A0G4FKR2_9ALVE|eukprot:Cvel_17522.t1-p1 / transcript=Cvel_17522.t1 / gene=Cvel_17522 / organism=Chromera_velia_CCMP2878 / gene_product=Tetratricopeptide repeat protein 27 homolog, putative / transcript_product=Tetratricopeptide repeat protein 27 homolog, putative / location=Cvel_scaffold1404:31030-40123(+) / protein_length=1025 / sequence_SO=supercontig / SO=protein_coding / is_pseudo=false